MPTQCKQFVRIFIKKSERLKICGIGSSSLSCNHRACVCAGATEVGDRGRRRMRQDMSTDSLQSGRIPGGLRPDRVRDVRG